MCVILFLLLIHAYRVEIMLYVHNFVVYFVYLDHKGIFSMVLKTLLVRLYNGCVIFHPMALWVYLMAALGIDL